MQVRPISWFSELSPEKFVVFERMKKIIRDTYVLSWFSPIETPVVERKETLLSKGGDDNEIYGVHRLNGEKDDAEIALRFDLTVPLARYVAMNEGTLKFPFKRCHIDRVYRWERAQAGRAREFYQADVDIIAREKLPLFADVEVIYTVYTTLKNLNFWKFTIHLNNKKILIGYLEAIWIVNELQQKVISLIDKKDKLKQAKKDIKPMFLEIIDEITTQKVLDFISIEEKTFTEKISFFKAIDHSLLQDGVFELEQVYRHLLTLWLEEDMIVFNNTIARGLNYYTGTLLETFIDGAREYGSIASGGRYENLVGSFSKTSFPGVGVSIGLTRLFQVLELLWKIDFSKTSLVEVIVLNIDERYLNDVLKITQGLRSHKINTEIYLDSAAKMKKQLDYANAKGIRYAVICGENEIKEGITAVKDLELWVQENVKLNELVSFFQQKIG